MPDNDKSCTCGNLGALWTVHRFPEQGPCLEFTPLMIEAVQRQVHPHDPRAAVTKAPAGLVKLAREVDDGSETVLRLPDGLTDSAHFILSVLLPKWIKTFVEKNADYGDQHRYALGPRAEWVGIDRKVTKLERVVWHGHPMNGEGAEEMLADLIGQSFLLLDLLAGNWKPQSRVAQEKSE